MLDIFTVLGPFIEAYNWRGNLLAVSYENISYEVNNANAVKTLAILEIVLRGRNIVTSIAKPFTW